MGLTPVLQLQGPELYWYRVGLHAYCSPDRPTRVGGHGAYGGEKRTDGVPRKQQMS